jgi:hypothetical protein
MTKSILTQQRLKELLDYDRDTGSFTRKTTTKGALKGAPAGCLKPNNYVELMVDGLLYKAHRLAWLYEYGSFPQNHLDHINGNKSDNRVINLREATHSNNLKNVGVRKDNKLGVKGIHLDKGIYVAQLIIDGKQKKIGRFKCLEDAKKAYIEKARLHYGEFYRE